MWRTVKYWFVLEYIATQCNDVSFFRWFHVLFLFCIVLHTFSLFMENIASMTIFRNENFKICFGCFVIEYVVSVASWVGLLCFASSVVYVCGLILLLCFCGLYLRSNAIVLHAKNCTYVSMFTTSRNAFSLSLFCSLFLLAWERAEKN